MSRAIYAARHTHFVFAEFVARWRNFSQALARCVDLLQAVVSENVVKGEDLLISGDEVEVSQQRAFAFERRWSLQKHVADARFRGDWILLRNADGLSCASQAWLLEQLAPQVEIAHLHHEDEDDLRSEASAENLNTARDDDAKSTFKLALSASGQEDRLPLALRQGSVSNSQRVCVCISQRVRIPRSRWTCGD